MIGNYEIITEKWESDVIEVEVYFLFASNLVLQVLLNSKN